MTQKTVTRADLTEAVYREIGFSYSESSELVDKVLEELSACLEEGQDVKLSSFGSFKVRVKQPRIGRNPKTKESATISARRVVTFHASNMLKKRINDGLNPVKKGGGSGSANENSKVEDKKNNNNTSTYAANA